MAKVAATYALGPSRVQFQNKDPRGWQEFAGQLADHSSQGSAQTMRGVQSRRPSLYDLTEEMKKITAPTLIITGDEDWACLQPGILMKKNIATAALAVMPNCGHAINLEDPDVFNRHLDEFFQAVELGKWPVRDPRAMIAASLGR
jgi:pimeloyl-ACP methyl ester carboxylesterase